MHKDIIEAGRVLDIESAAIQDLKMRLDESFVQAVEKIYGTKGKIIVTGIGKSGHVGRKISSTLSSTGTPSIFLHPAESSHGDLGVVSESDLIIAISYGGETPELQDIAKFAARKSISLILVTGHKQSSLARAAEIILDVSVKEEACPLKLAPTSSSTVTLALGDAIAMALLKRRGFKEEDFAQFHPGGSLGRRLLTRVQDVMHSGEALALVKELTNMREVLALMTQKEVRGIAGVVNEEGGLIGAITDGDIRRRLEKSHNPLADVAKDLMSKNPKTVEAGELAEKALFMMEQFRIQNLFVIKRDAENSTKVIGILHLQDLLQAKLR